MNALQKYMRKAALRKAEMLASGDLPRSAAGGRPPKPTKCRKCGEMCLSARWPHDRLASAVRRPGAGSVGMAGKQGEVLLMARIQRTAGPLGRLFGFFCEVGRLHVAFNAGWYVIFLCWRGFGYIHLTTDPWQVETYRKGDA